ncbi:MAG TPA: hypothetical protein VLE46_01640 [Nitrospira sp.]|nr:hypothetical protein [Nitrospira sp.]
MKIWLSTTRFVLISGDGQGKRGVAERLVRFAAAFDESIALIMAML